MASLADGYLADAGAAPATPAHDFEARTRPLSHSQQTQLREKLSRALDCEFGPVAGHDSRGQRYKSITELWQVEEADRLAREQIALAESEVGPEAESATPSWYGKALEYWDHCPATVDGVLGGYGHLSPGDVRGSHAFLDRLRELRPELETTRAVDCGAGIGRVAKHFLLPRFDQVHLLEQSPPLLAAAPAFLGEQDLARTELLCMGMQAFDPPPATYDVVWIQWVIGHLTDADLVLFLERCIRALRPGGCVCVKDNTYASEVTKGGRVELFYVDRDDSSLTRSAEYLEALFRRAKLDVVLAVQAAEFPDEIFPVFTYALAPRGS